MTWASGLSSAGSSTWFRSSRRSGELPDAYPVDEHGRRKDTTLGGIAAAGPTDCQGEHGRQPVAGVVERPPQVAGVAVDRDGFRRHGKVRTRTVGVVPPELETVLVPAHAPVVPRTVDQ